MASKNMVLSNDDILANVCEFVGEGHFFFVSNINKKFRNAYKDYLTARGVEQKTGFATTADSITESKSRVASAWYERIPEDMDGRKWSNRGRAMLCAVARKGNLLAIKWLMHPDQRPTFRKLAPWTCDHVQLTICEISARKGHLDVLQHVAKGGDQRLCNLTSICSSAAQGGHLHILQWARKNGCPWDGLTCAHAAQGDHLHLLQWARKNGCPWDAWTCSFAAKSGNLRILQWARENGCPWNEDTCKAAAHGGHLNILQWARANGCPWSGCTCCEAAGEGHLHILQWARENGCPWDEDTCSCAAHGGHLHVLQSVSYTHLTLPTICSV